MPDEESVGVQDEEQEAQEALPSRGTYRVKPRGAVIRLGLAPSAPASGSKRARPGGLTFPLSASARSLVAMYIMHCLAVKLGAVFGRTLAARRHWPMVALAVVEMMIYVSVEMIGPMIPRPRSDK